MTAAFDSHGPLVTSAEVETFESMLPRPLPESYRQFLLHQNGGRVNLWWPPELHGPDIADVEQFYSLGDVERWRSLPAVRATFSDTLPGVFLPIGADEGGAKICLSLQDEDHGAIWFYDPDREFEPAEPADPDLLRPLCASFTVLLETLEPVPGVDEALRRLHAAHQQP